MAYEHLNQAMADVPSRPFHRETGLEAPVEEPIISRLNTTLGVAISGTSSALDRLEKRLAPILTPCGPGNTDSSGKNVSMSQMAECLHEHVTKVELLRDRLQQILERVEV